MPNKFNTAARNSIVDNYAAQFNGGKLRIYTGAQPADPNTAPTGTLLVDITLPSPAFTAAASGQSTKNGTWGANASADGVAGWYRLQNAAATISHDGPVIQGAAAIAPGDLALINTNLATGQPVEVTAYTLQHPASI